jgi:hypothetical protein
VIIIALLSDYSPSIVVVPGSGPICVLVPAGFGNTSLTVAKLAADLFFVLSASVVSEGVASWTSPTSMTVSELYVDIICVPATSLSVSAVPSMLSGIVTEFTSRTILFSLPPWDWMMLLLVLLSPRCIGGREAEVFKVLADAYSARRGATLCVSGLDALRLGQSWLLVVDNIPLCNFFLTGWAVKQSSPLSVLVEGFLVGILMN